MSVITTSESTQGTATDLGSLYESLLPSLEALDCFLESQIAAMEPEIQPLAGYAMERSGKRLRSMLLFFAGWQKGVGVNDELVKAAAVIELVHLATLVHDDILDGADLRHQRPTVSQKFGASAAVLFGDALFAHALKLASSFPTVEVCRSVSGATRKVCAGEIKQNFLKGAVTLSLEDYFRMIELKTAELFWLSCRLGGYLTGRSNAETEALESFGRHLGIAYQIYDDVADLLGEEREIGKTLGTDLDNGKFTLPILLLFQKLEILERESLVHRLRETASGPGSDLRGLLEKHDIPRQTLEIFERELITCSKALELLEDRETAERLDQLIRLIRVSMANFIT